MVERGKDHLGALCVVAANLAERAWAVMHRGTPYVVCDTDGPPVTAEEAKSIIAEHWTVPAEARARRRSERRHTGRRSPIGIVDCNRPGRQPTNRLTADPL